MLTDTQLNTETNAFFSVPRNAENGIVLYFLTSLKLISLGFVSFSEDRGYFTETQVGSFID